MSEENVEIVARMVQRFNEQGIAATGAEFFADEIEFREPPEQPGARIARGREATVEFFAAFDAAWEEHRSDPEEVRAVDAERVLLLSVEHFRGRDGNPSRPTRWHDLHPAMLTRLYGELGERLAPRTVRGCHTVLRQALADAVAWQLLPRNPADRAKPPSLAAVSDMPPRTWSARQLDDFLAHVVSDRLYAAWRVAAMTGLRRGELLGLGWDAVDLDTGRLAITRTLIEGEGAPRFSEPKTKRGRRSVALDAGTVEALREHRERQLDERVAWGPAYEDHGLVFCRENGTAIWSRTFSRFFAHHVRDAGLPKIRFHDLRHTHATLALEAGVHPKVVQERLGHATIAITLDTYSHAIPAMQEDAATRIAALLGR